MTGLHPWHADVPHCADVQVHQVSVAVKEHFSNQLNLPKEEDKYNNVC